MIYLSVFSLFWVLFGGAGLIIGNDAIFITGIVSSGVYAVGLRLLTEIKKKENN